MSDVFGNRLGQYILLEQLGEGGMAKVYNALDSRAERNVAIKVILPNKRSSSIFLQQFEQEAKSLANLSHTNIVKVLNYGIDNGQPYLVMEFIPGGTLKESMQGPIQWETAATILAPIARALEYVHRQQIVHRDVKPSNILLDDDFRPMLSDFGIVKLLESKDESNSAAIGVGVGTPDYMPPEQGLGKDVDFRADIYSLGLVFYEMVTGRKPFAADTPMAAVIRHITDELPLPSTIDKTLPKFVESAMIRAIQKDPDDRYQSMGAFAEVLEMLALGKDAPIKQIASLSRKQERRQRPNYLLLMVIPFILGLSTLGYWYLSEQRTAQGSSVVTTAAASSVVENTPVPTTEGVLPTNTASIVAPEAVAESVQSPFMDPVTGITLVGAPLVRPSAAQFREIARWGVGGVNVVDWSPDGKLIALGTTSGVFIYDSQSHQLRRFINTGYDVVALSFHPNGELITAGGLNGDVNSWSIESGIVARALGNTRSALPTTSIAYSSNGNNVAIGFADGTIQYFKGDEEEALTLFQHPVVRDLAISTDNRFLYVSNGENKIIVWDIALESVDSEMPGTAPVEQFDLSTDGQFLLSAGGGNAAYLWDIGEGRIVSSFSNLGGLVTDLEFSNDDTQIVLGIDNNSIKVFAMPAPEEYSKAKLPLVTLEGLGEKPRSISFSPDQTLIAAGNWEDGLKIWDAKTGIETFTLEGHMGAVHEIYFSPDGTWLTTGHADAIVRIWKLKDAQETYRFDGYLPNGLPFSPDNRFLIVAQSAKERYRLDTIAIVELSTGEVVAELPDYQPGSLVQFTSDSKLLIVGNNHDANIWDVATWERLETHGGMNAGCGQYFTPQSKHVAVIYDAGVLFSYDKRIQDMCGRSKLAGATVVYYFEEEHELFFVLSDGRLWSWDFASPEISRIRPGDPYPFIDNIFLTADQKTEWYAYVVGDEILIRNLGQRDLGSTVRGQSDYQYRVALLPGQFVALGSRYGSIHIWTMP